MVIYDRENTDYWTGLPSHLWTGKISSLFYSIPDSYCAYFDDGDPIVVYDDQAERWIVTQFGLAWFYFYYPMVECIAVSATSDPMGPWYAYEFSFGTVMPDYPKFGVLPGALFMSINQFDGDTFDWLGAGLVSFDKNAMYAGDPDAEFVWFDSGAACAGLPSTNNYVCGLYSMLPSDLDGGSFESGSDPFSNLGWFVQFDDDAWSWDGTNYYPSDQLEIWYFYSDWSTDSFGVGLDNVLTVDAFDSNMCDYNRDCIEQLGTIAKLDSISDRLMNRLQMRDFEDYFTLVTNHTVDVDGSDHAGVRWYELRFDGGWNLYQQGTHSPDSADRWMGSAALDEVGNMALGYSIADELSLYPSIAYAGRLKSDPLGTLPRTEQFMRYGGGSQKAFVETDPYDDVIPWMRWGDYSAMTTAPHPAWAEGPACQFWYTNEYYRQSSNIDWYTYIGSFSYDSCWEGDTEAPMTTITSAPDDPSHSRTATFEFEATDGAGTGVDYFMCSLDNAEFAECTSPITYEGLAYGSHTFAVYAVDEVGNAENPPAGYMWMVDLVTRTYKSASGLDGWILEKSESSNTGGSFLSLDNGTLNVGDTSLDKQYKSILSFNTSNLPDTAIVLNAVITLYRKGVTGSNPMITHGALMTDIRKGQFPAPGGYASKFQSAASMTDVGDFTGPFGTSLKYMTTLIDPALPYISLMGDTQFRIYFALDDNDNGKNNILQFYSGDTYYQSKRPILSIDYYVP
jgi:hypothetical protein